ncbi:MAG: Fe-S cluster assembly ATPase SufC [SAR202 cluster bacterium]|nr:Fe-S cluster assembly ATPase SufC [SAR202 cluster bacterium]
MLKIKNLHVSIGETKILKGLDLDINSGEIHAIMGPNGSGKSTLANVIAGKPDYIVDEGSILFNDIPILDLTPDERANLGIFLAFQYPVELPGIPMKQFIKTALDSKLKSQNIKETSIREFNEMLKVESENIGINTKLIKRSVNEGFSGGEKKRNEMLQMALLKPQLSVLDETDSGLDIDALKTVGKSVNKLSTKENATLIVTHYQRLLNYITPTKVHVLIDGQISKSGGPELASDLENKGYDWVKSLK